MSTPQPHIQHPRSKLGWLRPADEERRKRLCLLLVRVLVAANLILGFYYLSWRYAASINWAAWPIALALLAAETYSYLDTCLFGLTIWRIRQRGEPPPPPPGATVDVFITCYNEPVDLVRRTAVAAREIHWPHQTYILDDGNAPEMRAMAEEERVGYIVRSTDWQGKERHAKGGNINNALFQTQGEFILILDADQIPSPEILYRTLGYFGDPKVAFVQTPQWFYNVPRSDPFGSQAPLFYGPIQQGKDGWNAAFFCGSNAVLRREALMQVGVSYYVRELERRVRLVLKAAGRLLRAAERRLTPSASAGARAAIGELQTAVREARTALHAGASIQAVTWGFQRRAEAVSRMLVREDLAHIKAELAEIPGLDASDLPGSLLDVLDDEEALGTLARRESSPLAAIEVVRHLLLTVDVDREDEAQPVMPLARISVTEDMATAMRLHALGWWSVYHHEILARGLAPEDLRSSLQQRLRWAQGTIQIMLRENPLFMRGLSVGQRLIYFTTMWGYLSGFAAVIYLLAPVLYLLFGILPVRAYAAPFFWHLVPYLLINQLLFIVIGWGLPTWRGQQYSLALFPLWIKAITSAIGNVYFGHRLGFVVTPKTRQGGVHLSLIWPQLAALVLLNIAIIWGLGHLVLGQTEAGLPILVNVFWACYDLVALSVVLRAATYHPDVTESPLPTEPATTMAEFHGRPGAGQA
jgi:cellulose synthase (UDP-forming)